MFTVSLSAPARKNSAALVDICNAAASRQRNRQFGGDSANRCEKRGAVIARRGNVQHYQLIGALNVVARRKRGRISGIAQIDEVHAFDDAFAVCIQARNDAVRQAHALPPAWRTKLASICAPTGPDFSGWNCVAKTFLCSSTATNEAQWSQKATPASPASSAA